MFPICMNVIKSYLTRPKRTIPLLLVALFSALLNGCTPDDPIRTFDESLLIGTWVSGTEYYRFDEGYNGATWDTADDVQEEEAQQFTWSLTDDRLLLVHKLEMGADVPKMYTVMQLDDDILQLHDAFDNQYTFTRI